MLIVMVKNNYVSTRFTPEEEFRNLYALKFITGNHSAYAKIEKIIDL